MGQLNSKIVFCCQSDFPTFVRLVSTPKVAEKIGLSEVLPLPIACPVS